MTSDRVTGAVVATAVWLAASSAAAQVDPADAPRDEATPAPALELGLGVRGVTSLGGRLDGEQNASTSIDFSDTLVYFRPRLALFAADARAGASFAVTFPDAYAEPGTLLVADALVYMDTPRLTVRLGRGRIKSRLLPLPTLRDDDLIRFSDTQNPFTDGRSTADLQYGNLLDTTVWITRRAYAEAHLENLPTFVLGPLGADPFAVNSLGMTVGYRQIPSLTALSTVRLLAVGGNAYHVSTAGQRWMFEVTGAGWINLVVDPVHNVDLRAQVSWSPGIDGVAPTTAAGTFQAAEISTAVALGYTYRRRLLPTMRFALVGGQRRYLDAGATQFSVVGNGFYSLGTTVEIGLQYQFQRQDESLPLLFGEDDEHSIKLALVGSFDSVINRLFDERDSYLNVEGGNSR